MNFLNSTYFLVQLAILIAVAGCLLYAALMRKRDLQRWGINLRESSAQERIVLAIWKRDLRVLLLLLALVFFGIAAARPWWGSEIIDMNTSGNDILVVFDVSKSMKATDVAPSRLEHAKFVLQKLIQDNPEDRFGIIAFAGKAFFSCPLTSDRVSLEQCIQELNPELVPLGGTNLNEALNTSVKALEAAASPAKTILLFTDGEELYGSAREALEAIRRAEIKLIVIGVGTPGTPALIPAGENGSFQRTATGDLVKTTLNEPLLRDIAAATGGVYFNSNAVNDHIGELNQLFASLDAPTSALVNKNLPIERFPLFLWPGVLCFLAYLLLNELPFKELRNRTGSAKKYTLLLILCAFFCGVGNTNGNSLQAQNVNSAAPRTNSPGENLIDPQLPEASNRSENDASLAATLQAFELYNQARDAQLNQSLDAARELYTAAIAQSAEQSLERDYAFHNLGVLEHTNARNTANQALEKVKAEQLDAALQELTQAEGDLQKAEELYINALRSAPEIGAPDTAKSQQLLLNDRQNIEALKKAIEELKKQQQQAQQQTSQAQQQNQQQQQQQDQQQGQDQQQSQGQQQNQDQQEQQGQEQQQSQGQQGQEQQQSQGQQGQEQQNQGQQQNSAQNALEAAQQAVKELQKQAEQLQQKQLAEQSAEAQKELEAAQQSQQQKEYAKAAEHLQQALEKLGQPDAQNQQGASSSASNPEQSEQNSGSESESEGEEKSDADQSGDQELPQVAPQPQQTESPPDKSSSDALLDLMNRDEQLLRDAIQQNRNRRVAPVAQDW